MWRLFYLEIEMGFFDKPFEIGNGHREAKARFALERNVDEMGVLELGFEV